MEPTPGCGNGVVEAGEACDDGNVFNDDGCSASCVIEICGDGVPHTNLGETCDDGNTVNGDGCSASCVIETCGDGIINLVGEQCDDGTANGTTTSNCNILCQTISPEICDGIDNNNNGLIDE